MDPIEMLVDGAVQHQLISGDRNPYLTMETVVLRLISGILDRTRVSASSLSTLSQGNQQRPVLFRAFHEEIRSAYDSTLRHGMSQEERAVVERVLSRDQPHAAELSRFACCWYKYDRVGACRLFAVDGILGNHPKAYATEAFSTGSEGHNRAVRELYAYLDDPEMIRSVVARAYEVAVPDAPAELLEVVENRPATDVCEPRCVGLYAEMAGEEEIARVVSERLARARQLSERPVGRRKAARSSGNEESGSNRTAGGKGNKRQKFAREEEEPLIPCSPPYTPPCSPVRFFSGMND